MDRLTNRQTDICIYNDRYLQVPASSAGESSLQTPNTPNTPEILNTIVNITENMSPQLPQHPLQIQVRDKEILASDWLRLIM